MELPTDLRGSSEDIDAVRALGLYVHNDNDPAPENIPASNESEPTNVEYEKVEAWHGINWRKGLD